MLKYRGWVEKSHSLRKEAALESGGMTANTSVSLARQQQSEQLLHLSSIGVDRGVRLLLFSKINDQLCGFAG